MSIIMDEQSSIIEPLKSSEELPYCIKAMLTPANSIISKDIEEIDERPAFKIDPITHLPQNTDHKYSVEPHRAAKQYEEQRKKQGMKFNPYVNFMTLVNGYNNDTLIFKKINNDSMNHRNKHTFFSSLFIGIQGHRGLKLPEYKGMLCDDDLIFDSNFESANLMAVYKIQDRVYDLILQNDLNTKGFTQWYNFKVHNKRNNFIARFNIVNLYKSKSLYNIGMKPIVRSEKSDRNVKKTWRRKGYNIYYQKNALSYEDNTQKCYKTLTFQYDFTIENDTVQFAHGMPYDLTDLQLLLNSIKANPRVKMSTIGTTIMGRQIPLLKISSVDDTNKIQKKALVILGRQHPGETPGSYIAEQMILELLRNSNESDFLTWRFDIFIIPMVNMDGVFLGNYRSNFAGFDLNRCWLHPDPIKQPEVVVIKEYIKKLQKKYKIELILDLHGHSRKMGTFFYGNNFGSNFMLFPYIASKANKNILLEKSKFSHQTENDQKGSTARVVLGKMIRETGYVYTYQVSFFGNFKEDHTPFAFLQDHYKELGKALVLSIYRTYLEIYKEEKTLKESYVLKNAKAEIREIAIQRDIENEDESGSDSEAQEAAYKEKEEIDEFFDGLRNVQQYSPPPIEIVKKPSVYQGIDRQISISKLKQFGQPVEKYTEQVRQKIHSLLQKNNNDLKQLIMQRLPSIRKQSQKLTALNQLKKQIAAANEIRQEQIQRQTLHPKNKKVHFPQSFRVKKYKNYIDWLKVYGETFVLQQREKEKQEKESYRKNEKSVHQVKQNLILINNNSKSIDTKERRASKQLNTINIFDNTHEEGPQSKNMDYQIQKLNTNRQRVQNKSALSKQFPQSLAFDQAIKGSLKSHRIQQKKSKHMAIPISKDKQIEANSKQIKMDKQARSKLPPL